jgi:mRNA-degrading endonuclease toxin of MazEF toxin-antitoxin module
MRFPGTVLLEADTTNGLRRASVALTFQLTVIDQRFIGTRLGALSDSVLQAVWRAFDEITERIESSDVDR